MTEDETVLRNLRGRVNEAVERKQPLHIQGGNTKAFYVPPATGIPLHITSYSGVTAYEPTELYITVKAGTALQEVEQQLALQQQMFAFEPPHFGDSATIGGMVACGLSGPRRPYAGSVRDAVLGVHLINGYAEYLRFGGRVMKNVAGYDVSRLMTGAFGTLGILTQITLRVMPRPPAESSIAFELPAHEALQYCQKWSSQCTPITATYYDGTHLYVRLSGTHESLRTTQQQYGGDSVDQGDLFWYNVREQTEAFFHQERPLWRIMLPRSAEWPRHIPGNWRFEWNGGLRWLSSDVHAETLRTALRPLGGHATLFRRGKDPSSCAKEIFHPLPSRLQQLHQRIRQAFDPVGVFNPHCLFAGDV